MRAVALLIVMSAVSFAAPSHAQAQRIERTGLSIVGPDRKLTSATFTEQELAANGMLCIRYNNYWCMKSAGWDGETGKDGRNHAIFSDSVYSARAAAKQLRTWWYRDKRRSAFDIMSKYAPPDDCVGSVGKPPNCPYGINPTEQYAQTIAAAVQKKSGDDLGLFKADGKMNRTVAIPLLQAIARFELPKRYEVSADLISQGIDKAGL